MGIPEGLCDGPDGQGPGIHMVLTCIRKTCIEFLASGSGLDLAPATAGIYWGNEQAEGSFFALCFLKQAKIVISNYDMMIIFLPVGTSDANKSKIR